MQKATTTDAAKANAATVRSSINTIDAQIEAAKVTLWRATNDFERYSNLIKDHSITQQQFEQAQAAKESAEKQVAILSTKKQQASQQTNAANVASTATGQQIDIAGSISASVKPMWMPPNWIFLIQWLQRRRTDWFQSRNAKRRTVCTGRPGFI